MTGVIEFLFVLFLLVMLVDAVAAPRDRADAGTATSPHS